MPPNINIIPHSLNIDICSLNKKYPIIIVNNVLPALKLGINVVASYSLTKSIKHILAANANITIPTNPNIKLIVHNSS